MFCSFFFFFTLTDCGHLSISVYIDLSPPEKLSATCLIRECILIEFFKQYRLSSSLCTI